MEGRYLDRAQKEQQVASLSDTFSEAQVLIVTQNMGLSVSEVTDLRSKMRQAGGKFKVAKNRLVKLALKNKTTLKEETLKSGLITEENYNKISLENQLDGKLPHYLERLIFSYSFQANGVDAV
mgnify:CR=1 FL=1